MGEYGNGSKLANRAVIVLALISVVGMIGGIVVAYFGQPVGAIVVIVTGSVSGIVAITLQIVRGNKE